jgi:hypothetical protein
MIYDGPLLAGGWGSPYMREPDDVFEDEDIETSTPLADATAQREELRNRFRASIGSIATDAANRR